MLRAFVANLWTLCNTLGALLLSAAPLSAGLKSSAHVKEGLHHKNIHIPQSIAEGTGWIHSAPPPGNFVMATYIESKLTIVSTVTSGRFEKSVVVMFGWTFMKFWCFSVVMFLLWCGGVKQIQQDKSQQRCNKSSGWWWVDIYIISMNVCWDENVDESPDTSTGPNSTSGLMIKIIRKLLWWVAPEMEDWEALWRDRIRWWFFNSRMVCLFAYCWQQRWLMLVETRAALNWRCVVIVVAWSKSFVSAPPAFIFPNSAEKSKRVEVVRFSEHERRTSLFLS